MTMKMLIFFFYTDNDGCQKDVGVHLN